MPSEVAGDDPTFSVIFSIHMTVRAFDALEGPVYRMLMTGRHDDHIDVWPEKRGRWLFAHAPVDTSGLTGALSEGQRLAQAALELCPAGSVLHQVEAIGWHDPGDDDHLFWSPVNPPAPDTAAQE